ncbi:hypothetical protein ASPCAL04570 [Aspergillus calidoustus]|uniref:SUN domain-containing protein n=1 Tax=Aspergillus calidoustus TaxID=454130 RepID=A0A0U5FXG5_ASPCI|nr:hypothetical protein ASPCAL04570 [Aspergillus calidoustus]
MPPKRAATPKRAKSSPRAGSVKPSPNLGVGALPHIPTKHSFAYGSSATPILPHMLAPKPLMSLDEMANNIEDAVQTAKEREINEMNDNMSVSTRSRSRSRLRNSSEFSTPPRRLRREPTPDETQLHQSLEQASSISSRMSSLTPVPPSRHSFSSVSSVEVPRGPTANELYPEAMHRQQTPEMPMTPNNPLESSLGDSSAISYNIERNIVDENLTRTRTNITAPPRRLKKGRMPFAHIEEEDESSPSPVAPSSESGSIFSGPIRNLIPHRSLINSSPPRSSSEKSTETRGKWQTLLSWLPRDGIFPWILRALLFVLVLSALYMISDSDRNTPTTGLVDSSGLKLLSKQVNNLGSQVSSLSKDLRSMKTEVRKIPAPTTIYQYPKGYGAGSTDVVKYSKTNFLSIGAGVLIDPYMTSPTAEPKYNIIQKAYLYLTKHEHYHQQPPRAALTPWEDYGDCWCSAPRQGMSQLAVILSRRILPEEVVVEHMPKAATLRPEVAPQNMELWVRYRYVGKGSRPYKWSVSSFLRGNPKTIAGQDALKSDRKILRGPVLDALRLAWRDEPDSSFSDDPYLGPDFYKVGTWMYDINDMQHIQRFPLTAIIDSDDVRVDKVVFRVNSNWGGNETCIYRVKLHGRL